MPKRTLYAPILFLVGLVITGIPAYGVEDEAVFGRISLVQVLPEALPPASSDVLTNPEDLPLCPPPSKQNIGRPPIPPPSPAVGAPGVPRCKALPGIVSKDVQPSPPSIGPCPEECLKMLRPEDREEYLNK